MEAYRSKFARRYDREFKENAVALVQSGRTITRGSSWTAARTWTLAFPQRTESSRRAIVHLHEGQLSYGEGPERRVDSFGRVDVRLEFSVRAPRRTEVIPHAGVLHTDDARHDMAREEV